MGCRRTRSLPEGRGWRGSDTRHGRAHRVPRATTPGPRVQAGAAGRAMPTAATPAQGRARGDGDWDRATHASSTQVEGRVRRTAPVPGSWRPLGVPCHLGRFAPAQRCVRLQEGLWASEASLCQVEARKGSEENPSGTLCPRKL